MQSTPTRAVLDYAKYKDKVLAGWIGKSIGGVIGAPLECHKELKDLSIDAIWPDHMAPNDDLDLQVVWLEAMQERSLYLTSDDLADFWRDRCWYSFCEYGVFLNNVQRGIAPPLSGTWNNHFFHHSEGCPIRADIWGFIAPNNPKLVAELACMDGQLDHGEISIQTEQFLAVASMQALLTDSLDEAIEAGLSVIPADSPIALAVPRVREIAEQYTIPRQAWRILIREFGHRNANDAITNHAITLLALFLGKGDLKQTMLLCANFGWDTDCTASTAGALLSTLSGTAGLPADWVEKLGKTLICGINVKHQGASLESFAEDTCLIGLEMAAARNPYIEFVNAPVIEIREPPAPKISIGVEYTAEPVLWNERPTSVVLNLNNPTSNASQGHLHIAVPNGVEYRLADAPTVLEANAGKKVEVIFQREKAGGWIPDKNLFEARWEEQGEVKAKKLFGLGGARQWQIYGPYWDMWDKTVNPVCPYMNDKVLGGPFVAGLIGDCYNHYAELDSEYLDETRLLSEDILEELPFFHEDGEDVLNAPDFGGFQGQACYYLVRTIRTSVPDVDSHLVIGRTGPYRAWLDGVELGSAKDIRCWAHLDSANLKIKLTGEPQRLVIKLIRLTDDFKFSAYFMTAGDPTGKQGVSNILDLLENAA